MKEGLVQAHMEEAQRGSSLGSYWLEGCGTWLVCACRYNARESTVAKSCNEWEFIVKLF